MNYKYDLILEIVIFLLGIAVLISGIWVYDGDNPAWLAISAGRRGARVPWARGVRTVSGGVWMGVLLLW